MDFDNYSVTELAEMFVEDYNDPYANINGILNKRDLKSMDVSELDEEWM